MGTSSHKDALRSHTSLMHTMRVQIIASPSDSSMTERSAHVMSGKPHTHMYTCINTHTSIQT
jgi:hypothetical protein